MIIPRHRPRQFGKVFSILTEARVQNTFHHYPVDPTTNLRIAFKHARAVSGLGNKELRKLWRQFEYTRPYIRLSHLYIDRYAQLVVELRRAA